MNSLLTIFKVPGLIAILSLIGLFSALIGDGIWDVVSWISLSVPAVEIARAFFKKVAK